MGKRFAPTASRPGRCSACIGLAGVDLATSTGSGSVTYWNAYVGVTQMHGIGTYFDARFSDKDQYPVSAKSGAWNTRGKPDRVTAKLAALHFYQLSMPAPKAPDGPTTKLRSSAARLCLTGGDVRDLSCPAAVYRAGTQFAHAERDRHRLIPGRPFGDSYVPHGAACRTVDAPERRLLPRRPFFHVVTW